MGSGKSQISKTLSEKINFKYFDLDHEISKSSGMSLPEIFETKGEIYFRKLEKSCLEDLLTTENNVILSLGGGTPAYFDNIKTINTLSKSIYLRTSIRTLCERLMPEKSHRPLIANISNDDLPEFIAKHLFERTQYYNQAEIIIDTDQKSIDEIVEEINSLLF